MKKNSIFVWIMSLLLLLSSCSTTESGAYTGAMFGSMIGSAIGGITGGWRGSDIGQLAGMAGGAIAGAAVGKANEESRQRKYDARRRESQRQREIEQSDYDPTGHGDDRITFDGTPYTNDGASFTNAELEIRHPQVLDVSRDGVLSRGEEGRVVFEIYNSSSTPAYGIHPIVSEVTGNKHIRISENVYVESIQPHQGIRYTAMVKADSRLKDGEIVIRIAVRQGGREVTAQTKQLRLRTSRR